jgi:methionyl aminopeptidase
MIFIKTAEEIASMRIAGKRHAEILNKVAQRVAPGISTGQLDHYAEELVRAYGDIPAFKGYTPEGADFPFPGTLCISINDEVVHGIPDDTRILEDGDIVSLDLGLQHNGVFVDGAITVPVGTISSELQQLLDDTKQALEIGIAQAKPGNTVGDIGNAIESFVAKKYGIVQGFAGHGVGRYIHEDPHIPNYGKPGMGAVLKPGMTIAIEPMLNLGKKSVEMLDDGYTIVTRDGSPSAHFEHTILITEHGPEILTK